DGAGRRCSSRSRSAGGSRPRTRSWWRRSSSVGRGLRWRSWTKSRAGTSSPTPRGRARGWWDTRPGGSMPWRESPEELARARAEQPVIVPTPGGHLYGIFTPPAPDASPADLCVVLFTRPRFHRNRMWVEAARWLAARGFACFRFDYHGTGDSEGEAAVLDPNRPYREDAVAVLRHLREHLGQTRFVLSGLCFDARTARAAVMDEVNGVRGRVFVW